MSKFLSKYFTRLNFMSIHGTMCCKNMYRLYESNIFGTAASLTTATTITDANLLILWGSLSQKLIDLIRQKYPLMPSKKAILHIRGCEKRVSNKANLFLLEHDLPINIVHTSCHIDMITLKKIIDESKVCLRA